MGRCGSNRAMIGRTMRCTGGHQQRRPRSAGFVPGSRCRTGYHWSRSPGWRPEVQQRRMPALQSWKEIHMAISGYYSHGVVSLIADADASNLTVSRNAAGTILVNGGAVAISGGVPTVANTSLIQVFGLGGDEFVTLD